MKTPLLIRFEPATVKRLRSRSATTGVPVAELVRRFTDAALARVEERRKS